VDFGEGVLDKKVVKQCIQHFSSCPVYRSCSLRVFIEGEQPDVSRIFQVSSQTLTSVCQTNVYMTPAQVTPHVGCDAMDSQVTADDRLIH